jgi:hypothetical protein
MTTEPASNQVAKPASPPPAKKARAPRKSRVKPGSPPTHAAATPNGKRIPMAPIGPEHPDASRHLKPLDPRFAKEAAAKIGQAIPRVRAVNPADVEPIHCRAFFKADLKTGRLGVLEVTMQIPWEYRDRAVDLLDLAGHPMELYMRPCARR